MDALVNGINSGNLDALTALYEPNAAFATQPGTLVEGPAAVREALAGFVAMKGTINMTIKRILKAADLAVAIGSWSFVGTAPGGTAVHLSGKNVDVLRRQGDGSWLFALDNPWGIE
jgi:ketosteroid isomerase-like protein